MSHRPILPALSSSRQAFLDRTGIEPMIIGEVVDNEADGETATEPCRVCGTTNAIHNFHSWFPPGTIPGHDGAVVLCDRCIVVFVRRGLFRAIASGLTATPTIATETDDDGTVTLGGVAFNWG